MCRPTSRAAVLIVAIALGGCRPRVGARCDDVDEIHCNKDGALVCVDGRFMAMECVGTCVETQNVETQDRVCLQSAISEVGKACYVQRTRSAPRDVFATSSDGSTCLSCDTDGRLGGARWKAALKCGAGERCEGGSCKKNGAAP